MAWIGVLRVYKLLMMHWYCVMHGGVYLDLVLCMMRHGVVENGGIQFVVHDSDMFRGGHVMHGSLVMNGSLVLN